ncbi:MAG: TonB-dependent receptor, partial [Ferruginibacter sp.]
MNQKLMLLITAFFLFAFQAEAQKATITGKVMDPSGNAVKTATIMLYRAADSALIKTEVTDASGNFEIAGVKPGQYYTVVSFVGYKNKRSAAFTAAEGKTTQVPDFKLQTAEKSMQAVTVTGSYKKPMIEVKADKTIFNVESSINATGSNAFELLQKSPGVVTDKDDNITLKGKNGVKVYIDGRPVQMSGADLAAYLRSVNSMDIESIEMITNPSAKYDASGNAGIINIKFKKNKKFGMNGSFSQGINIGESPKSNQALSINYRDKKVNLFSNYSNNWGENVSHFYLYRKQDSIYDATSLQDSKGWSHNFKAGIDIFATKEQTIGFIFTANLNNNTSTTNSRTPISDLVNNKLGDILYAQNIIPNNTHNYNYNFNYRFADSTGHEFTIDANHGIYVGRKSSYQPNSYFVPYPETFSRANIYRNNTPSNIYINTAQLDYETPFVKGALGVGFKISAVKTDNTFDFYNVINGDDIIDLNRSNTFAYTENVNAGYLNYNRTFNPKWGLQAGVR